MCRIEIFFYSPECKEQKYNNIMDPIQKQIPVVQSLIETITNNEAYVYYSLL